VDTLKSATRVPEKNPYFSGHPYLLSVLSLLRPVGVTGVNLQMPIAAALKTSCVVKIKRIRVTKD
jgi:hypothetical protein